MRGVEITGNAATEHGGGMITGGNGLTLDQSVVSDNSARAYGGIATGGPVTITRSTISGNTAELGAGGLGYGGGRLEVERSLIADNAARA